MCFHNAKKKDAIIKNAFCVQFNFHRIKYDKYNFFEFFFKLDVCAT